MRRSSPLVFAILALAASLASTPARAQEPCKFLCDPAFVLQPGAVTTNFIDQFPEGSSSNTEFNARFLTAIPTAIPRTTLVAIVQWTPFADKLTGEGNANSPALVYGPVISIINSRYIGFDFDVLGSYGPAAELDDESDYTHKLVLEGDLSIKIGRVMNVKETAGQFQNISLYAFLAYVATGIPDEASPWALLYGVSMPIAPWR